MTTQRTHRRSARLLGAAIVVTTAVATGATSTEAHDRRPDGAVVARGLDNPRGMDVAHGRLYIAESGTGGSGSCVPGIFSDEICLGATGAVTEVSRGGRQRRIADGLPSLASPGGVFAYGPSDVSVDHGRIYVSIGGPDDPAWRGTLLEEPISLKLGTVQRLLGRHAVTVGDVAAFTGANDPDGPPKESNTQSVLAGPRTTYATDSAGNLLVSLGRRGEVELQHVFPDVVYGDGSTTDAVPTNLAIGPDGAVYVSTLTGVPFPAGLATVWRWDGARATPFATGLTTAVDLDFGPDGSLYVVEMHGVDGMPGNVLRIRPDGTRSVVADGLDFPTGITVTDDAFYVTNHGTSPDIGEVKRYRI